MPADPLALLFERACRDGHTWLPEHLVTTVAPTGAMAAAAGAGAVVRVPGGWALSVVAEAEELLADALLVLVTEGRLVVVDGPAGDVRTAEVTRLRAEALGGGAEVVVVDDADRLSLEAALLVIEELADPALLLLAGDAAALPPVGPGDPYADLVASQMCPVRRVGGADGAARHLHVVRDETATPSAAPGTGLDQVRRALRDGRLAAPDPDDRSFVVVPVDSDAQAAHRAGQVAAVSIPRAFGCSGAQVAVLAPLVRGDAGRDALAVVAPDCDVRTVHDAAGGAWPAVVLVLPPTSAGVLDRSLLVAAATAAQQHLTVVHGVGPDLARAVADLPRRPRRTRLAALLRASAGAGPDTSG